MTTREYIRALFPADGSWKEDLIGAALCMAVIGVFVLVVLR